MVSVIWAEAKIDKNFFNHLSKFLVTLEVRNFRAIKFPMNSF